MLFFLMQLPWLAKPVPDGYTGPVVQLADSGYQESGGKGQFFVAAEIDGKAIQNSLAETRGASYGRGFALSSRYTTRDVPVVPMKVQLIGTHQTAAPIHQIASRMIGQFFSVEGVVDFSPVQGHQYKVVGVLAKEKSCVWIADAVSSELATAKICTQ